MIDIDGVILETTHEDLTNQIIQNFDNNPSTNPHGTLVSGHVAAHTNNSIGISGVGYNCKMVTSDNIGNHNDVLLLSQMPNVKVINLSWRYCTYSSILELLYKEIWDDNQVVVVCGAANGTNRTSCGNGHDYAYPASYDHTISVSSVGHKNPIGYVSPIYGPNNWKDVHEEVIGDPNSSHTHNDKVDICAPGYNVLTTKENNTYGGSWGTSFASPIVAGVCGLMYSANPCLSPNSLRDILKNTADDIYNIPENQPYLGQLGTGRVNAFEAVKAAQASHSTTLDLFIKDRPEDFGVAGGYQWSSSTDESPDIWVRNQNDGLTNQVHQSPVYQNGQTVYIYVRVRNKSCVDATGNEQVSLYWSKASSWSSWPQNWDGSQPTVGDHIGSFNLGNLEAGQEVILEFTWNILNPYVHANWATCLLARVENSTIDPITIYPNHLKNDVYYNNNIAMRNVTIVSFNKKPPVINEVMYPHGKFMYIGNPTAIEETYDFKFTVPEDIEGQPITDAAEMKIIFDTEGWDLVKDKVRLRTDVEVFEEKVIIPINQTFEINNVTFPPNIRVPIYVGFNFLSEKVGDKNEFKYDVNQYLSENNSLLGGEHFIVRKHDRDKFSADAGDDQKIKKDETVTVSATDIIENATYNWYDEAGNLIYTGKDLSISPQITEKYKLEVIANADGFKDYDEVIVEVKDCYIDNISPNPASSNVTVEYKTENTTSAYIMVLNSTATINNNYIVGVNQTQTTFNVTNFQQGTYSVILVCDGVAVDMKTLIVQ